MKRCGMTETTQHTPADVIETGQRKECAA